jgi:hypothetical protein
MSQRRQRSKPPSGQMMLHSVVIAHENIPCWQMQVKAEVSIPQQVARP